MSEGIPKPKAASEQLPKEESNVEPEAQTTDEVMVGGEAFSERPKQGERVIVTAVEAQGSGKIREGVLLADIQEGSPLVLYKKDTKETLETNPIVKSYRGAADKFYVQTQSGSVYQIDRVK